MATDFGRRLREARERKAWTQEQLAAATGMAQGTVASAESRGFGSRKTPQLAFVLGVNAHWLATGEGEMLAPEGSSPGGNWTDLQTADEGCGSRSVAQQVSHTATYAGVITTTARVPVIGTFEMGKSDELHLVAGVAGQPVGTVAAYSASPKAYAMRVVGDSLYPVVRHGACIVVEPGGECVAGELVLLELADGEFLVRELVASRADSVTVLPVAGGARATLPRSTVRQMEPIGSIVAASKFTAG